MAAETKISWADSTVNFWIGCTKISPACDHCYAETLNANRLRRTTWGPHGERAYIAAGWKDARKFQRAAAANGGVDPELGRRRRVFVNSLSDFFDNHRSIIWRDAAWQLMLECPFVDFILLTKRPENILKMLPPRWGSGWPNVWIGTTVEDQRRADHRVPALLKVPAVVRFLSCEPLLGPVNLSDAAWSDDTVPLDATLDWIIAGGESGKDARPSHPDWFRALRDFSQRYLVAFHFKQWGEWAPADSPATSGDIILSHPADGFVRVGVTMRRLGVRKTGNTLDGHQHLAFPQKKGF